MPNFTKYENHDCFSDGLKFIAPNEVLTEEQRNDLWETMNQRLKYDSDGDMWGF